LALASLVVDLHVTQIVNGVRGVHALVSDPALAGLMKPGAGRPRP
jgi:acetamidase/formamidase